MAASLDPLELELENNGMNGNEKFFGSTEHVQTTGIMPCRTIHVERERSAATHSWPRAPGFGTRSRDSCDPSQRCVTHSHTESESQPIHSIQYLLGRHTLLYKMKLRGYGLHSLSNTWRYV